MDGLTILRTTLKANGLFSMATASLTLLFGNSILAINEMASGQPLAFSIQLFSFAALVLFAAYWKKILAMLVWTIIVLDILYVLLGFYNLMTTSSETSAGGMLLISVTNLLVAVFAVFQTIGMIGYRKSLKTST